MNNRAETWLRTLVTQSEYAFAERRHGVLWCDASLNGRSARYIAVVPDPQNPFPRARDGEVGLLQGWMLAHCVREAITLDRGGEARAILALVDVPSQAYGRREEALCIPLALAAAVAAYANARVAGHPTVALLMGNAFSGAFLAHGYQCSRLLALDAQGVHIHAMGKQSAARVTRRTLADLDVAAQSSLPMAYDLASFSQLGILDELIPCSNADSPTLEDISRVVDSLCISIDAALKQGPDLLPRVNKGGTGECRGLSLEVRQKMQEGWICS
jgi:malonate decarboxylase gamma subunit